MTYPPGNCKIFVSSISKRAQTVNVKYRLPSKGAVTHLVIDATGLKVFGEGEWKQRKHGKDKRRVWRKLHLAVDARTHEVIAAEVSLENVADNEVLPTLLNPLRRQLHHVSGDDAYDTRECHQLLLKKGSKAHPTAQKCGLLGRRTSKKRGGHGAEIRESVRMEKHIRLPSAFAGRNGDVPLQAAGEPG